MPAPRLSTFFFVGPLVGLALFACGPKPKSSTPPAAAPTAEAPATAPRVDPPRLFGVVEHLASDALGGRYTLSDDIRTSADWLAAQLSQAGVAPVGKDYAHEFTLVTGAEPVTPPTLSVITGTRRTPIESADFAPAASSASATVTGEVVFVGYAARSTGEPATYDDLAGVDLKGKIALVLEHQPSQPDVRAFWSALRERARAYESAAAPLREAGDTRALGKLKAKAVAGMSKLAQPWLGESPLTPEDVRELSDPATPLDAEGVGGRLTRNANAREGVPRFAGFGRTSEKIARLAEAGAVAVIVVHGPRSFVDGDDRKADALPELQRDRPLRRAHPVPVVHMKWRAADARFKIGGKTISALQRHIDTKRVPRSGPTGHTVELAVDLRHIERKAPNVLATIPGTDLAHEVVVFGAHYDHVGRDADGAGDCHGTTRADGTSDTICNGADDNASGTAIVVELARALAEAGVKPRRSLVFALFSGEELGLLGSKAMAESLPKDAPFAGGKIVAMVNIDMVGRLGDKGLAIGGVGSSTGWMDILDESGNHGMPILYDRAITTRSDHAAFYEQNTPVLFFFTHTHPDYHAPGDESDRINRDGLVKVAELVQDIAVSLADGHAIAFAPPPNPDEGLTRSLPGDNPATVVKRVAADGTITSTATPAGDGERATP